MAEYEQVVAAGNQNLSNAFRVAFNGGPQSDIPQLTAWADEDMDGTAIECLVGTTENASKSMIVAASTNDGNGSPGVGWAAAAPQAAGGAAINRLRGSSSYVLLGTTPPIAPFPVYRTFNFAQAVCADSSPGTIGYQPVIAVKVFYVGAAPTVEFQYNSGTDGSPTWVPMTSSPKGTAMPLGVQNTIHATGPDTVGGTMNDGVLDPVTKPGSGEKIAEEYWIRTL